MKTDMTVKLTALALATALTTLSTAAFAQKSGGGTPADGAITIDQTKAMNGAVTPGDNAGFPVTISQSGTYRLMSHLTVPAGVDGIVIAANVDVVIDMNGFSIVGPVYCDKQTLCHSETGTIGIRTTQGTTALVSHGRIRGFTYAGISDGVGKASTVRLVDMQLSHNSSGAHAYRLMAKRVYAEHNARYGLIGTAGSIVDSITSYNGQAGISLWTGSVRGNTSMFNNGIGYALGVVAFQDNASYSNQGGSFGVNGGTGVNNAVQM